jgi:DNA-binding LacI/PurR family transcriptional regulator
MRASEEGPRRRPPTLEEVAAHAGVGRGTASRVVNGEAHVSEAAREAVLRAVDELGYVPNRAARALVTRLTDSVALVVSESEERFFGEPFFAGIVRSVSAALAESGRQLFLSMATSDSSRRVLENHLTKQHVDGVMLLSTHGDDPLAGHLEERGLPTVLGGRPAGVDVHSYVDIDNVAGAEEAVRHLVAAGRRRIATITGPTDMMAGVGRLDGYRRALVDAGLPFEDDLVFRGDFSEASGGPAASALLDRRPDIDAIFAASDPMAYATLRVLAARGVRVPDDVAVVGFDDAPSSAHTVPLLTTVHQPVDEMGREMVRLLVARIENRTVDQQVILQPRLVVRESA